MREKTEKLVPCPIARSSNNDAYNDICKATGQPCPYFIASDTKSGAGVKSQYTNTIKRDKSMRAAQKQEENQQNDIFVEELEAALKQHEVSNEENGDNT